MARYYIEEDPENPGHMTKKLICGSFLDASPIGTVLDYAGSGVPAGWLACNGQAVSRSEYKFLFDVIGTTYGTGDGSTTFNVPNEGSGYDYSNAQAIATSAFSSGYAAPADGLILIPYFQCNSKVTGFKNIYINGNIVASPYSDSGSSRNVCVQAPVKKGDVITIDSNTSVMSTPSFVPHAKPKIIKAKLEANAGDIGLKVGAPKPDWGSAEAISLADAKAGYTVTSDGLIVGFAYISGSVVSGDHFTTINGVKVAVAWYSTANNAVSAELQCPVKAGDVLQIDSYYTVCGYSFVPYF